MINTVPVPENELTDGLRFVVNLTHEPFAEVIAEWPGRVVGDCHANAAHFFFVVVNVVGS